MQISLAGLWQLSPLTDLSIPQDDITFPAPLSEILPRSMLESAISNQEWHLMHDIDIDDTQLAFPGIDLVMAGVDYYAEIRVNGVAVFDCDGLQNLYKKDIRPYLQPGKNRFEILFVDQDEDWLVDQPTRLCGLNPEPIVETDERIGVWQAPRLQFIRNVRLDYVTTEQIWHRDGVCEFKVNLYYQTYAPGLVSASVQFNGMTYHIPIDVRADHATALFQIDAPRYANPIFPNDRDLYQLNVMLDGQSRNMRIGLSRDLCVTHFPL